MNKIKTLISNKVALLSWMTLELQSVFSAGFVGSLDHVSIKKFGIKQPGKAKKQKAKTPFSVRESAKKPRFSNEASKETIADAPKKSKVQPKPPLPLPKGRVKKKTVPLQIPVEHLQDIAVKKCSLLPEEVSKEKLQAKSNDI
ncbi:hypothetical protein E2562_033503 [Oryza meyeriana var. granulata]|uniref:Uncharacterized protein n=1 Tax=Oryza meyeriana var. granulata TaxID=110450 RepID=A0A6G1EEK0_9ORYZ|nr:hypothetical protein E2562_033503 [Oryza meyeriana var. granulata]